MAQQYVVGLGSNRRHPRHGPPASVLAAALKAMAEAGLRLHAVSPIVRSRPLGPSRRAYANAAARVETGMGPDALLAALQAIEAQFGRRRRGQRWGERVLDLDILLWDAGAWSAPGLTIPHPAYRMRRFVLAPLCAVAPGWRDPGTGLAARHLHARLTRPRPLPKRR